MILRLIVALWLSLSVTPAQAEAVRVSGGEHGDFTRLVIEYPGPVEWKVGRTADGYALRLTEAGVSYDLSKAFDLIGKDRLAGLWVEPDSGALHLGIGCACFAIPFEFRPGTLVIDIRPGAPPKGSSFEEPLESGGEVALTQPPVPRPASKPEIVAPEPTTAPPEPEAAPPEPQTAPSAETYDWTAGFSTNPQDRADSPGPQLALDLSKPGEAKPDLEPLRQSLIEELSRGASQGIVDMAKPRKSPEPETAGAEAADESVDLRLGEAPNLVIRQKGEKPEALSAKGVECVEDEKLNLAEWAEEGPIAEQFGPKLSGLTGEFDRPDPEAVGRAVRFYLNLGFGAEARSILRAFPTEQEDEAVWLSMARILDGEEDPDPVFSGMAACDTSAALWAVLADPEVLTVGQVEKAAILRAFSALPIYLRQQLGPTMVDRFLAMKDFVTATALRDAVLRGTSEPGPEIELMEAAIEKASGSPAASEARLEELTSQSGPTTPAALSALVIQLAEHGQAVSFAQVQAMEEYSKEREGSEDHAKFHFALTLAYGASGDFEKAFDLLPEVPEAGAVLWQLLGQGGRDEDLLDHAALDVGEDPPVAAREAATLIAQRMITLGLADQAARWLAVEPEPPKLLAARVALGQGRAEAALELMAEEEGKSADDLRIAAYQALGDETSAAALYATRDMPEEAGSAMSRTRDWQRLASDGPEVWKAAARNLLGSDASSEGADVEAAPPAGPLEESRRLIDDSVATREALSALLMAVKSPDIPTQ